MFGWFRPRCPVDPPDKVWIERRMTWLAHVLGIERCRAAQVVLPTPDFFPDTYHGEEVDVRPMLDRVCRFMGVDAARFDLDFFDTWHLPDADALGVYVGGEREKIFIRRSHPEDPIALAATLAHEVGHAILLGEKYIDDNVIDHEFVTDLLTVYCGMGVFTANSVMRESHSRDNTWYRWEIGKQGYL